MPEYKAKDYSRHSFADDLVSLQKGLPFAMFSNGKAMEEEAIDKVCDAVSAELGRMFPGLRGRVAFSWKSGKLSAKVGLKGISKDAQSTPEVELLAAVQHWDSLRSFAAIPPEWRVSAGIEARCIKLTTKSAPAPAPTEAATVKA